MTIDPALDVTVVIPFADDEDSVGRLAGRTAAHLRALNLRFEILAVDEGSGDNSLAVLSLVRRTVPELRVIIGKGAGRGFADGAAEARGSVLWLLDAACVAASVASFLWAYTRVRERTDAVVVEGRYVVCRRTRVWHILDAVRGRGGCYQRRFSRRAAAERLKVERPARPAASRGLARWLTR